MVSMTMKANLWIIVLVCGCLAKKEELGELSAMLKNPAIKEKLIQEIQKRLEGGIKPECTYKSNSSTIIRTTESLAAGAKFLKNAVVISSEECVFECCQLKTCNVAVFKEKKKPACYLFNCGDQKSKCLFAEDAGFSVLIPNNPAPIITSSEQSDKHASDLEKLSPHRPEEVPTTTTTTSTTTTTTVKPTTKKPTTTTTTTTLAPTHREPVPLFGPCHSAKDCAGSSTECLAGYCVCMDGYHAQDGVCRKDCGRFEFECANDGRPLLYPQCIAIYDRCDGIKHCKDSSDEQECPRSTTARITQYLTPSPPPLQQQEVYRAPPPNFQDQPIQHSRKPYHQALPPLQPARPKPEPQAPELKKKPQQKPGKPVIIPDYEIGGQQPGTNQNQPQYSVQNSNSDVHDYVPKRPVLKPEASRTGMQMPSQNADIQGSQQPQSPNSEFNQGRDRTGMMDEQLNNVGREGAPIQTRPRPAPPKQNTGPAGQTGQRPADTMTVNLQAQANTPDRTSMRGPSAPRRQFENNNKMNGQKVVPNRKLDTSGGGSQGFKPGQQTDVSHPTGDGQNKPPNRYNLNTVVSKPKGVINSDMTRMGNNPKSKTGVNPGGSSGMRTQGGGGGRDYTYYNPDRNNYNHDRNNYNYYYNNGPMYGGVPVDDTNTHNNHNGGQYDYEYADNAAPKNGLRPRLNTQRKGPPLHIGKEYQSAGRTHGVGDKDQLPVKPPEGKPEEPDNSQEPSQSQNAGSWQRPGNMGGPPPNPHGKQPLNPRPTLGPHPTAGKLQRPGGHWRKTPSQGQGDVGPNQRPQTPIHQGQEGPIDKDQGQQVGRPGHWRQAGRPMQPSHSRGQHISKLPTDAHGPNAGSDKDPSDIHSGSPKKAVPTSPDAQHVQNKEPKTKTPAVNTDQGKKEPSLRQGNDTAKVEAAGQQQEIDKQEKGQFYAMESNQGAVIALAMGLAVTALLLIFVGCRLRNVKKRLRRGRALHSNEADYLINGMYL